MISHLLVFLCILIAATNNKSKEMPKKPKSKSRKAILILRVSTAEQARKGTSLESQEIWGKKISSDENIPIIETIRSNMSGFIFPKRYYKKILKIVKDENVTHIFVYSLDRFSRNLPWGSKLVEDLWEKGVQIVTKTLVPDLDNPNDRAQVWLLMFLAEINYSDIHEKTSRGIITKLSKGEYFYDKIPFGYYRVDLEIFLDPVYKPIIIFLFNTFIQKRSYAESARLVNDKYGKIIGHELKARHIKKIISDKIYIGYFSWNGITIGKDGDAGKPRQELIAIDIDTFEKAQHIAQKIGSRYTRNNISYMKPLSQWRDEYGPVFLLDNCENLIVSCPKCGSIDLISNGKEIINGTLIFRFRCRKDNHKFRFPAGNQLKHFRSVHPLRCMNCGVPDHFEITRSQLTEYYTAICTECGYKVLVEKNNYFNQIDSDPKKNKERKRKNIKRQKIFVKNNKNLSLTDL